MTEVTVVEAGPSDMQTVRQLFLEYQRWLGIDLCFQGFEAELARLPDRYAPPGGFILLGTDGTKALGCVAVRPHGQHEAELKRLYVNPNYRGDGTGRRLFDFAMRKIRDLDYRSVVLDTLPGMEAAQAMYRKYGFRNIGSYTDNPIDGVEYFQFDFISADQS